MLEQNIIRIYEESFRKNRELPAVTDYFKKETFTYMEMSREIAKLHLLFKEAGVERGDKIALIGRNNPRWCITYIATITYGAVTVPILQDFNTNDIHHIVNHSESKLIFCGDTYWDRVEVDQVKCIEAAFSLTDFGVLYERGGEKLRHFQEQRDVKFRERYPQGFLPEDIVYADVKNEEMVLLNYTSGTTGFSKGVMISCNNLTGNVAFCMDQQIRKTGSNVLAFLPLAHTYGCMVDMLLSFAVGGHVTVLGRTPSPKILIEAMAEVKPEVICCVPLIIENICRRQIFPKLDQGMMKYAIRLPILDQQIFSKVRETMLDLFGGNVDQFVIGGAPLNPDIEEFLHKIKFPFTVGYGLTECAPLVSFTHSKDFKPTSCGMVLHNYMEVKIDSADPQNEPGEILVKGHNVMMGYYKNKEATDEVLYPDGWLNTGDIGTVDPDGTIYIKGRSKSMILGASGQNIYPEVIESKLNNLHCVYESLVVEREGRIVALVYPDYDQADKEGYNGEGLKKLMDKNLETLNTLVAPYERVSEIVLYPNEFEKTPKKSIKRYLYEYGG